MSDQGNIAEGRCLMHGSDCGPLTFRVTIPALAETYPVEVLSCLNPDHLGGTVAGIMRNRWQHGAAVEYISEEAGKRARR